MKISDPPLDKVSEIHTIYLSLENVFVNLTVLPRTIARGAITIGPYQYSFTRDELLALYEAIPEIVKEIDRRQVLEEL